MASHHNNRPNINLMQATPHHTLVPVESLTSSPTSSTGSASILDWNSNSDGELLQLSPPALTALLSPLSDPPQICNPRPLTDDIRPEDLEGPFLSQWEITTDTWTPLFKGLMPPAPISVASASATSTVVGDTNCNPPSPHLDRINKLCNEFDEGLWFESSLTQDERQPMVQDSESTDGKSPEPPMSAMEDSNASTIVPQHLGGALPSSSITTSTIAEATAPSPPSSVSATPVAKSPDPFPLREDTEPETISIAEYFQRKALSAEEAAPRVTPAPVEAPPPRPGSANTDLSYFTESRSPAQLSASLESSPQINPTTINQSEDEDAVESHTSSQRPIRSLRGVTSSTFGRHTDDLLTRSTRTRSPLICQFPNPFLPPNSPGLFGPHSSSSPSPSELEMRSPLVSHFPLATADSPSPYNSPRSNSPTASLPRDFGSPYPESGSDDRLNRAPSPEFPRRSVDQDRGSQVNPPWSPEFPRRDLGFGSQWSSRLLPNGKANESTTGSDGMGHRMFNQVSGRGRDIPLPDAPVPNISSWFNLVKSQQPGPATSATSVSRTRPPLPPLPPVTTKGEVTPQFTLCSDLGKPFIGPRVDYYAEVLPSSWGGYIPPPPWVNTTPSPPSTDTYPSPKEGNESFLHLHQPSGHEVDHQAPDTSHMTPSWGMHQYTTPYTSGTGISNSPARTPNPYYAGLPNPQYSSSKLSRDHIPPPQPPSWASQRRLRFAPLPPTPNYRPPPVPAPVIPPYTSYASVPSYYNSIYRTPSFHPPVHGLAPPHIPASTPTSNNNYPSSKKYWFTDATVIFRVENCLYRVHRHFFERHSTHLSRILSSYLYSPTSHLFLTNVKKVEFERLLSIFYPSDLAKPDITTISGWTSMLELSIQWDMAQVKELAIQKLGPITSAIQKINIARKHAILNHEWLIPAYTELCARRSPLTLDEAEDLDLPTVIKIWEVQHSVHGLSCDITEVVKQKFGFVDACLSFTPRGW